jgi:hypothetical protein
LQAAAATTTTTTTVDLLDVHRLIDTKDGWVRPFTGYDDTFYFYYL